VLLATAVIGCTTPTELCACEPAAVNVLFVHGAVTLAVGGAPVAGASVTLALGESGAPVRACTYDVAAPENPAPVETDAAGRYSITITTHSARRRCLQITAARSYSTSALIGRVQDLVVFGGLSGVVDTVRVDVGVVPVR
jgi:hypothetical protein